MPSRAVVRKKARRDAKRLKDAKAPPKKVVVSAAAVTAEHQNEDSGPLHRSAEAVPAYVLRALKEKSYTPPPPKTRPLARQQSEGPSLEGLTHKERRRVQTQQRLEKQMARLQANDARAQEAVVATEPTVADDEAAAVAAPADGPKMRHDPRFTNGTFWRDRKEKRGRTLFLGGIPAHFTLQHIKDFVSTVVDTDPAAPDYLSQLPEGTPIVESVDMLNEKHGGKLKHMYIVMASVPIAFLASRKLDGMKMDQRSLRCNFAADKTQRAEAIKRRGTQPAVQSRGRGGRGFGRGLSRGAGRGFDRSVE